MSSHTKLVVYVDVDDTFVRSVGTKRIAMPHVIEHVKSLHREGTDLYCWSSGGAEYAKSSAIEFGIDDCFVAFLPKPNVLIDDQEVNDWRTLIQIHPAADVTETVNEWRARCLIKGK